MITVASVPLWPARIWEKRIGIMLAAASAELHGDPDALRGASVDLTITCDAEISAYNERFLGCAGPTNILSFPAGGDDLGSLVLSADTLLRECRLYGQPPREHSVRLLAHGLGHLLGFDHGPEMDGLCSIMEQAALASEQTNENTGYDTATI